MATVSIPVRSSRSDSEAFASSLSRSLRNRRVAVEVIMAVALVVASLLLFWGGLFARDMVHDQLADQRISFPPKGPALDAKEFPGLQQYAGKSVNDGPKAKAYANEFIAVHLKGVANGKTYSEVSAMAMAARADAAKATTSNAANASQLEAKAAKLEGQTQTLFRGETLRGLLLYAWGWSLVGRIALFVASGALLAGVALFVLALYGIDKTIYETR